MEIQASNTACANCNDDREEPFRLLHRGVDSLYLSYQGRLRAGQEKELVALRELARSVVPVDQARAQIRLGDHNFQVLDKGAGYYPFGLAGSGFRIRVASRQAKRIPVATVQVASEFLAFYGPEDADRQVRQVLLELLEENEEELRAGTVSRADLFADFSCGFDMEQIGRHQWVTRAEQIATYSVRQELSGWTLGLGGPIAARLYNKTMEIEEQSQKYFFHSLWAQNGWIPTDTVWRLEFELKRAALANLGVTTVADLKRSAGSLWRYVTSDWARLTVPNAEDETRSRWPNHPLWSSLQAVPWEGVADLRIRELSRNRAPKDGWYFDRAVTALSSFMAREGIFDPDEGWTELGKLPKRMVEVHPGRYGVTWEAFILEKVRLKERQYNTGVIRAREPGEDAEEAAREYLRRTGKGG